jgi:hypothetical protein
MAAAYTMPGKLPSQSEQYHPAECPNKQPDTDIMPAYAAFA